MNQRQKQIVQSTFSQIAPSAERVATLFYQRLFEIDPTLRRLFVHLDMNEQGRKLMTMLAVVIKQIDKPQQLATAARHLGERHVSYGVEPQHYALVGQALLETLSEVLGTAFDDEAHSAWANVYGVLSEAMLSSALTTE